RDAALGVQNALRRPYPRDLARCLRPEGLRIGAPAIIGLPIAAGHRFAPFAAEVRAAARSPENCRAWRVERQRRRSATLAARDRRSKMGMNVGANAILSRRGPGGDHPWPVEGRVFWLKFASDAAVVARRFAGQGGGDRAADPDRPGLGQRVAF